MNGTAKHILLAFLGVTLIIGCGRRSSELDESDSSIQQSDGELIGNITGVSDSTTTSSSTLFDSTAPTIFTIAAGSTDTSASTTATSSSTTTSSTTPPASAASPGWAPVNPSPMTVYPQNDPLWSSDFGMPIRIRQMYPKQVFMPRWPDQGPGMPMPMRRGGSFNICSTLAALGGQSFGGGGQFFHMKGKFRRFLNKSGANWNSSVNNSCDFVATAIDLLMGTGMSNMSSGGSSYQSYQTSSGMNFNPYGSQWVPVSAPSYSGYSDNTSYTGSSSSNSNSSSNSSASTVDPAIARGLTIFNSSCFGCHGSSINNYSKSSMISSVERGKMPKNGGLSSSQKSDLLAYLNSR